MEIRPDGVYIDGTAGGGGHSKAIADRLTTGTLLSIDQDPDAVAVVKERLKGMACSTVVRANFSDMDRVARERGLVPVDGVLLDIGVSSYQLDTPERGFSYHSDAPLDMRMSKQGPSAKDLVNTLSWQELAEIISRYGEDRNAKSIAKGIVRAREDGPIETTGQLAEIIKASVPALCAGTRASGQENIPGVAHRGKRRVGCAVRWVGRCVLYPKPGGRLGSHHLSFLQRIGW